MDKSQKLKSLINKKYRDCGIDLFGVTNAVPHPDIKYYNKWVSEGFYADMDYLKRHETLKATPLNIMSDAKSILCFGVSYNNNYPYSHEYSGNNPLISRFALGYDYHIILRSKLKLFMQELKSISGIDFDFRICVDSAPILERSYCVSAGLGWIGRNGTLINETYGSFIFLAEVLINIQLEEDKPIVSDFCKTCGKCVNACPTGAITDDRTIDARKCLSYLTIEHRGEFPDFIKGLDSKVIFGCDVCQEVCPFNKDIPYTRMKELTPRSEILNITREDCFNMTKRDFTETFRKNSVKRAKYDGFIRNIKEFL